MHSNKNIKLNKVIELLKDPKSKLCTVTIAKNSMIKTTYFCQNTRNTHCKLYFIN